MNYKTRSIVAATLLVSAFLLLSGSSTIKAQEPVQPSPAPAVDADAAHMAEMQKEIDFLRRQKELVEARNELTAAELKKYQSAVKDNSGRNGDDKKNTTFTPGSGTASPEVASLSYQALSELSGDIERRVHPVASQLSGVVFYNDADFDSLAKYRIYRRQSDIALRNFDKLKARIDEASKKQFKIESVGIRGEMATTLMSLPNIATGFLGDVGSLLQMFRSTTTITEWPNTLDNASLETAMANAFQRGNPGLKVFMPGAFTPEYDLEKEGKESILIRVTDINQAYQDVDTFIGRVEKLPANVLNDPTVQSVLADARVVRDQLGDLAIGNGKVGGQPRGVAGSDSGNDIGPRRRSDLEQLIRAEKLDRFLRQTGNVGILKVRLISSGGSRRQTSNLLFGDHVKYSGGVIFEVLMFDLDGTVKVSDIYSWHTGFRKLDTAKKPKP
ncbi:MAG TPA: hypothetical protein VL501_08030 [Pyrinomonadaceae bacterium]|nr:hypothetical protein [Pyrinomonadaceae bacterium]